MNINFALLVLSFVVATILSINTAQAASYKTLINKGYKTSKMTKNRAGNYGWYVSNGKTKYFCKLRGGVFQSGKSGLIALSSSGRVVKLDRKTFEKSLKQTADGITQFNDAKMGRIKPYDVRGCNKQR